MRRSWRDPDLALYPNSLVSPGHANLIFLSTSHGKIPKKWAILSFDKFDLCRQEREAREGRGRKGSEEKLLPLVEIL